MKNRLGKFLVVAVVGAVGALVDVDAGRPVALEAREALARV